MLFNDFDLYRNGCSEKFFFFFVLSYNLFYFNLITIAFVSQASWLLILFGENVYYIYIARLLHGVILVGTLTLCQLYLVEIASDSVRGALGSVTSVGIDIGTLLAFILGAYFNYRVTPIVAIAITLLFTVVFAFFPETPLFLLKRNQLWVC